MIDEFHGLDATARLVLYALRPRTSSSSSLSPRISLRFLALLIYFHFAGQQQQPQPQQLLLLLLNLIQLNFVIHFVRLLLEPLPSTLSLPFAFFRYTEYQQRVVLREMLFSHFEPFQHLHNSARVQSAHQKKVLHMSKTQKMNMAHTVQRVDKTNSISTYILSFKTVKILIEKLIFLVF